MDRDRMQDSVKQRARAAHGMGQEGTRILAQSKGKGMNMTNEQLINEAIAILQTMNMEDCALAIDDLRNELERVKQIARDRLDTIQNLRHDVAVLEDKLEDTRSDVRAIEEVTAQLRRSAANALLR